MIYGIPFDEYAGEDEDEVEQYYDRLQEYYDRLYDQMKDDSFDDQEGPNCPVTEREEKRG